MSISPIGVTGDVAARQELHPDDAAIASTDTESLAEALAWLLVPYADRALAMVDAAGVPIYHVSQPLTFAPTGRRYSLFLSRPSDRCVPFVMNVAYGLGFDVPVHPSECADAADGIGYPSAGRLFEVFANAARDLVRYRSPSLTPASAPDDAHYFRRFLTAVCLPGDRATPALRAGDILVQSARSPNESEQIAVISDPVPHPAGRAYFASCDAVSGRAVACIAAGEKLTPRFAHAGRALLDDTGGVRSDRFVLRFTPQAANRTRIERRAARDALYRDALIDRLAVIGISTTRPLGDRGIGRADRPHS
jgi:hypothetical protein